ncbi:MAG: leucine-rich repeat domain-containing protein [Calditrichae bacterium]|nr:leucine-rich repeat domain-containing protein [Calditrichia bacterium]
MTGLQFLYLSNNQISDIQFLEKLTGLQFLYEQAIIKFPIIIF